MYIFCLKSLIRPEKLQLIEMYLLTLYLKWAVLFPDKQIELHEIFLTDDSTLVLGLIERIVVSLC